MLTEPPEAVPASRGGVVTALLLLVVVGAVTLLTLRPPAPEPADAPADTFSAARAMETVTAIAEVPLVLQYDRKRGASKLRLRRTIAQYLKLLLRDRLAPAPYRVL